MNRKIVLSLMGIMIIVIFAASLFYRVGNPSLVRVAEQAPARQEMAQAGGQMISDLMVKLKSNPEDFETVMDIARAFMAMRAWEKALPFLQKAREKRPEDAEVLQHLGLVLFQAEHYAEAEEVFEHLLEMNPEDGAVNYNLGILRKYYLDKKALAKKNFKAALNASDVDSEVKDMARKELEN